MSWRDVLPIHPAAEIFPLMSEAELHDLAANIAKHGLREKIDLYWDRNKKPFLIDGRNRLDALASTGRTLFDDKGELFAELRSFPPPKLYSEEDCYAYVVSKNFCRRHLTSKQKRDVISTLLKIHPEISNRQLAKQVGRDDKTVAKVRRDLERRAEIPHIEKAADSKGRRQKIHKSKLFVAPPTQPATTEPPRLVVRPGKRTVRAIVEQLVNQLLDLPKTERVHWLHKIIAAAELDRSDLMTRKPPR